MLKLLRHKFSDDFFGLIEQDKKDYLGEWLCPSTSKKIQNISHSKTSQTSITMMNTISWMKVTQQASTGL